jgi:hypothetical protein
MLTRISSSPIMTNINTSPPSLANTTIINPSHLPPPHPAQQRSRNNSTSSASLSISPHSLISQNIYYSPPKPHPPSYSPSSTSTSASVKFSTKSASMQFNKQDPNAKYLASRKAGGRMVNMSGVNWMHRGGKGRNLSACMEIGLHKVKTKIDLYTDLNALDDDTQEKDAIHPYLYRVALAIGDIEIKDKLATSAFNMFLFRYESEQCPKQANSNMIFFKLLCSRSMDSQRLLECDIKLSVQPLRLIIRSKIILI